jgi:hypothetical protein
MLLDYEEFSQPNDVNDCFLSLVDTGRLHALRINTLFAPVSSNLHISSRNSSSSSGQSILIAPRTKAPPKPKQLPFKCTYCDERFKHRNKRYYEHKTLCIETNGEDTPTRENEILELEEEKKEDKYIEGQNEGEEEEKEEKVCCKVCTKNTGHSKHGKIEVI